MTAWYNEIDPKKAAWLRELIKQGAIAPGVVDERSIEDVVPSDLEGFIQCHFFAGVGIWSYSLRLAGISDYFPLWTGSCPCQPFSVAGQGRGNTDERHLWPVWFNLIKECKPNAIYGEQVASNAVIGKTVQKLQRDKIFRLLQEAQSGRFAEDLQAMREYHSTRKEGLEIPKKEGLSEEFTEDTKGFRADKRCKTESKRKRIAFQSGLEGYSESDRKRDMRGDGDTLQSDNFKSVECTFNRSDRLKEGVYQAEYSGSYLSSECNETRLGRRNNSESCGRGTIKEMVNEFINRNSLEDGEDHTPVWIDSVFNDLESAHYTCGALVFPACSIGAPHIRSRTYWVAYTSNTGHEWRRSGETRDGRDAPWLQPERFCIADGLGNSESIGWQRWENNRDEWWQQCASGQASSPDGMEYAKGNRWEQWWAESGRGSTSTECGAGGLADLQQQQGLEGHRGHGDGSGESGRLGAQPDGSATEEGTTGRMANAGGRESGRLPNLPRQEILEARGADAAGYGCPTNGFWRDADWLFCRDGKWRPVRPGSFPLVDGAAARVVRLRGYGDGIVAEQAAAFIEATKDHLPGEWT